MKRSVHHLGFFKKLCVIPVYLLLRLWYATLRIRIDKSSRNLMASDNMGPCVFYFWHQNLFVAPVLRKLRKHRRMFGLMSASKDGAWLETLVKWFHVEAIRGSSSWRGTKALQELESHQNTRCDIIITPDGPKGPRCQCKPGSLHWTTSHHFDVIALNFKMHRFWQLNSWDGFKIPYPFSKISIQVQQIAYSDAEHLKQFLEKWL